MLNPYLSKTQEIGRCKVSEVAPQMNIIANMLGLRLGKMKDFMLVKKILVKSIMYN